MILKESFVGIIDNSGAKRAQCICVLGHSKVAKAGDLIVTSIKKAIPKKFKKKKKVIKRGEVHKLVLCVTRFGDNRLTGHFIRGPFNAAIVLRKENLTMPFSNRVKSPVLLRVRNASTKVTTMAPNVY